ncbi:MAG: hypothetical protein ACRDJN_14615 [Chloroflexota bacterium]
MNVPGARRTRDTLDTLGTPITWPFRAWLVVEVGFGLAAISAIFLFPGQTDTNFAWPIKPPVMAAVLGAFYLASAFLFLLPLFARRWEQVRVMVLPAAIFTTIELIATFLHWDKFAVGTQPFSVWFASYLLPPPIFAALYWWQQRRSIPVGAEVTQPLPPWFRNLCLVNGGALAVVSGLLFLFPGVLIANGPWAFTPLTTRALCGWLIAVGLLLVCMAWENDWGRIRLGTVMLIVLGPALLLQVLRFSDQANWANVWLLIALADLVLLSVMMVGMWLRHPAAAPRRVAPAQGEATGLA